MAKINKTVKELRNTLNDIGITPMKGRTLPKATIRRFIHVFEQVHDPREPNMILYPLEEILLLSFLAVLGGANTWVEISSYGTTNIRWLRKFSKFKHGTPSHDDLCYVFGRIDHKQFQSVVVDFLMENLIHIQHCLGIQSSDGYRHLAIDGKEENGTGRSWSSVRGEKIRNIQTLHVWDTTNDICLYSKEIEVKTNEIPVAQEYLENQSDLSRTIITFDALHTQRKTIRIIRDKGGDYVAGLKGNHSELLQDAMGYFKEEDLERIRQQETENYRSTKEKAHAQTEIREYYRVTPRKDKQRDEDWKDIRSFICVVKTTIPNNPKKEKSIEIRYYISSSEDMDLCMEAIRRHWLCEIGHWYLDVSFSEDYNSTMNVNAFENLSLLIKMILALIRLMKALPKYKNYSIKTIRKVFGWNYEETLCDLFSLIDKDTVSDILKDVKLTATDRKKITKTMKEYLDELPN